MANEISPVLQNSLLQLSNYIHEDERAVDEKKLDIENLSNTILKKIHTESSDVPTDAKLYLQKIAESIIDKDWSSIPQPKVMHNDLAKLRSTVDSLKNAISNMAVDLSELMRVMIGFKAKNALNMMELSILDTKLSTLLQKAQFEKIDAANKFQLGAEIAQHSVAALAAGAQIGAGSFSLAKNASIFTKSKQNIKDGVTVGKAKNELEMNKEAYQEQLFQHKQNIKKYENIENNPQIDPGIKSATKEKIDNFNATSGQFKTTHRTQGEQIRYAESKFNKTSAKLEKATSNARVQDDIHRASINLVKSILDGCFTSLKHLANQNKLDADKLEAAKNLSEKSSASLRETSKSSSDDIRTLIQTISSIEQLLSSAMSNALRL